MYHIAVILVYLVGPIAGVIAFHSNVVHSPNLQIDLTSIKTRMMHLRFAYD